MIWIYAIILFTCAIIILLVTEYSQFKFNKNYANNSTLDKKIKIQYSVGELYKKNEDLTKNITSIENHLSLIKQELAEKDKTLSENTQIKSSYELLMDAEKEYTKGDFLGCATLLSSDSFNPSSLGKVGTEKYNYLSRKTFKSVSSQAYWQGYNYYKNKHYEEAVKKFNLSVKLSQNQSFSDDAYYFLALSYYKLNKIEDAQKSINILLEKYPRSNYIKEASNLQNNLRS
jgi:TolA-binding protein